MRIWVITNGKDDSYNSTHASRQSAEKHKKELEAWSNIKLNLKIKEDVLKL